MLDYQCVTEGAVASSRLMDFVPHAVLRPRLREIPIFCSNFKSCGELSKNPPFPNWESGLDDIWE